MSLASLTALVSAMDGANRYDRNCVIFKMVVQQWEGRWEAVIRNFMEGFPWERMFTKEGLPTKDASK